MARQQAPERIVLYGTDEADEAGRVLRAGARLELSPHAAASVMLGA